MPIFMLLGFIKNIPSWVYWVLAIVAVGFYLEHHGATRIQEKWDRAEAARQILQDQLEEENKKKAKKREVEIEQDKQRQKAINDKIIKDYKQEIANLSSSVKWLSGLQLGPSFACPNSTGSTTTPSTTGGNGTNISSGILPEHIARDFEKLTIAAEHDAAVARACQKFIRENGLYKQK